MRIQGTILAAAFSVAHAGAAPAPAPSAPASAAGIAVEKMRFENTISTFDWAIRNTSKDRTFKDVEIALEYLDASGARLGVRTFFQKGNTIPPGKDTLFTEKDPGPWTGSVRDARVLRVRASYLTPDGVSWDPMPPSDRRKGKSLALDPVQLFTCGRGFTDRSAIPAEGVATGKAPMVGFETALQNDGYLGPDPRDRAVAVRASFQDGDKVEWGACVGTLLLRWSDERVVWKGTAGSGKAGALAPGDHLLRLTVDDVEVARVPIKILP
ncbi:MAG: hypothetical protein U0166_24235 [Acidobacteriota bacterium]